ncbi:Plexin-B [Bienertia sinuspersici]
MNSLEEKLKGLAMTEEEEEIIDCEEEEEETIREQLMLCLVGKLFTSNPYSIEAMKNTMKIAWRLGKGW